VRMLVLKRIEMGGLGKDGIAITVITFEGIPAVYIYAMRKFMVENQSIK
jgi:hypothetical protein